MSAVIFLVSGCNGADDNSGDSLEGKWYCYEEGGQHTRLYLELKDGKADLIITAWGDRYKGPYTYDGETITLSWDTYLQRGNAGELGQDATLTSKIFDGWPGATSADHPEMDNPIHIDFKVKGKTAACFFVGLEMEMVRK